MNQSLLKNKKGITLVELLAVIIILGIVAAIAVPSIGGVLSKARSDADAQTDNLIIDAALRYVIQTEQNASLTDQSIQTVLVNGGYLNAMPTWKVSGNAKTQFDATLDANGFNWTITLE